MADQTLQPTAEELAAIEIAREMARAGIPIFVCPPNPYKSGKYFFKAGWQQTPADPATLDEWRPGWGVGAVGGGAADFLDIDPRNGGDESQLLLKNAGQWPLTFGTQSTPSGGTHHMISATGERKETGFLPGIDFQAGADTPDENGGYGRAFVWLAPTIGVSKVTGEQVPYRWVQPPDLEALSEYGRGADASTEGVVARVHAHRALKKNMPANEVSPGPFMTSSESQLFAGGGNEARTFTPAQARAFTAPALDALRTAEIGSIEERGMDATLALEHFVPSHLSAEQAFAIIEEALSHTAYDPNGPSDWTADKFLARLDGRRPVPDSWKAVFLADLAPSAIPASEVTQQNKADWLMSQLVTAEELAQLPAPVPLVYGMLDMNTESWLIGAPGSFKSFVALDIAAHVAGGREWQKRRVRQGEVLYLAAEGAGGMTLRTRAWQSKYGAMTGVRFLPLPLQVKNANEWSALVEVCGRIKPALVVIDTQHRVTKGLEENSATDFAYYLEAIGAIRMATGACVLTVHHTGRNGQDARGSSAIDGAQDSELKLQRVLPRSSMKVIIRDDKQKDMAENTEGTELKLEVVDLGIDPDTERPLSSLALMPYDVWREAEIDVDALDLEPWRGQRPGEWTARLVAAQAKVQRRILQVLRDHAGSHGLIKADILKVITDRWEKPSDTGWVDGWSAVKDLDCVVNTGGERWALDETALSD